MSGSTLRLPDGRDLQVRVAGPTEGPLLVFHHGSPGAAVPLPALEEAAAARGVRVAIFSRPGFGASSRRPGRRAADVAADVAALAERLGAEHLLTVGWSGGGPHALATAALLTCSSSRPPEARARRPRRPMLRASAPEEVEGWARSIPPRSRR